MDADALLSDPRLTAAGLLSESAAALEDLAALQAAEHGLTFVEFIVLLRLARTPGQSLRMADLAAQVLLSPSGLTRVADRMERDGLIRRRACRNDRRGTNAEITPLGHDRLLETLPGHLELLEREYVGRLEPDQLACVVEGLRVVRDGIHAGATAGAEGLDQTPVAAGARAGRC